MYFSAFVEFYLSLMARFWVAHYHRGEFITSPDHPCYRRSSLKYRKKQGVVKNFWIGASLIALVFPYLAVLVFLTLATTFVSFCILDETE